MSTKKKKVETAYGYSSETDHLVEFNKPHPKKKGCRTCCVLAVVLTGLLLLGAAGAGVGLGINYGIQTTAFQARIASSNLMQHLQDLDDLAKQYETENGQYSRAVQYGYDVSANMVIEKLKKAGFEDVSIQTFTVATYEETGDASLTAKFDDDFTYNFIQSSQYSVMRYSNTTGGMEVMGDLDIVEESCVADNYTEGTIALVDYNTNATELGCTLLEMTELAASAGCVGMIMMRTENDSSSVAPTTRIYLQDGNSYRVAPIPVLGMTYSAGKLLKDFLDLSNAGTVQVTFSTNTTVGFFETYNVLAYTSNHEKDDAMIVVGSHLDSVAAGPGINDNGSGSAANLEMAIQVIQNMKPINKVLFAFWGAEELGLLGSSYYVSSLDDNERQKIALNLNFDMIGSPNYVRQVYNGSGAENSNIVQQSGNIQKLFEEYFMSQNLDYSLTTFNGRSDYGPFIAEGVDIPAGGLATGADKLKTEDERARFGGVANAILDPCYHKSCDTVENVNQDAFLQMSQAAAYVLDILMMEDDLNGYLNS